MEADIFWLIIETARSRALALAGGSLHFDDQLHELRDLLEQLTPNELVGFQHRFQDYFWQAYRQDIWAVVYWRYCGCGDDSFIDVRSCLIALGKTLYNQIIAQPDCLADLFDRPDVPFLKYEGFNLLAYRVYEHKFGKWPHEDAGGLFSPIGDAFDFNDRQEMRRRFPRHLAKYPTMGG